MKTNGFQGFKFVATGATRICHDEHLLYDKAGIVVSLAFLVFL